MNRFMGATAPMGSPVRHARPDMVFHVWLWIVFFVSIPAFAVDFATPILMLDPGMHSDPIQKMAMDRDERLVATISRDKTVRIWKLPSLNMWKAIRVPMVQGNEGRLHAVAVLRSGSTIAVAGETCNTWIQAYCIYLFNTFDGKMPMRITGLPQPILDLAFSPDGQYLAAVMANGGGLRVFRVNNGQRVARDGNYGGHSSWVRFSRSGRVITTSDDGKLRLYDATFRLQAAKQLPPSMQPHAALFSPDELKIAVSFLGKPVVSVFSAKNLDLLYLPDMTGVTGHLGALAWSADGTSLYGAGTHSVRFKRMIRWWSNAGQTDSTGKGEFIDLPVTDTAIQFILSLKSGGVLFTSLSNALGQADAQGFLGNVRRYPNIVFPKCRGFLKISPSGKTISFPMTPENSLHGTFSLEKLQFSINKSSSQGFLVPKRRSASFQLSSMMVNDTLNLEVDGRTITTPNNEEITCFAVAQDERFFVASTHNFLVLYDKSGVSRWRLNLGSPVRALNITDNGKYVIAAHFDGTVNWYQITSGKMRLSFFAHAETGEWIAWTPDYFHVSSQQGENFLGWHKNVSLLQAAEFTPIAKLKNRFNKPSVVQRALD
ncbi:MAG: hypothetical protein HQL76_17800 [Magnetococcales bacterium]|nr:hypothetical protein [Magnetococcales bacterium]